MPKTIREVEVKLYLCFLDALLDQNAIIETIEIEDNVYPEQVRCSKMLGTFRSKTMPRNGNVLERIYLKMS